MASPGAATIPPKMAAPVADATAASCASKALWKPARSIPSPTSSKPVIEHVTQPLYTTLSNPAGNPKAAHPQGISRQPSGQLLVAPAGHQFGVRRLPPLRGGRRFALSRLGYLRALG